MTEYIRFDDDPSDLMFAKDVCQYLGISRMALATLMGKHKRTEPMPFRRSEGRRASQPKSKILVTTRGELDDWIASKQELTMPQEPDSAETAADSGENQEVKFENLEMEKAAAVPEESAAPFESVQVARAQGRTRIPVEVILTPTAYAHCKRQAGYQRRSIEEVVTGYLWQSPLALYRF